MSGKPSIETVDQFRNLLSKLARGTQDELEGASKIALGKQIERRGREAREQAEREIFKLMEQIDIKADGNCGWEQRMSWFLSCLFFRTTGSPSITEDICRTRQGEGNRE